MISFPPPHQYVGMAYFEMVSSLKEVVDDLKSKFAADKYKHDPALLKLRVKEHG